tara:strand:- start:518 stop:913 length:396 start_codon:yes stop_codon:yes gene_type:complete
MKTMTKTFICITLVGFALALVSCGAESLPPEPEMIISDEEKALLVQIEGAGGEATRDEDDNLIMITLTTGGEDSNVTDAWIDKNLESLKKQTKLEELALRGSEVTKGRIEALKKELPKVDVTSDFDDKKKQ